MNMEVQPGAFNEKVEMLTAFDKLVGAVTKNTVTNLLPQIVDLVQDKVTVVTTETITDALNGQLDSRSPLTQHVTALLQEHLESNEDFGRFLREKIEAQIEDYMDSYLKDAVRETIKDLLG